MLHGRSSESAEQTPTSRTLVYAVYKDGDSIGSLKVQQIIKDTMTYYQSHLDTRFRVVISVTMRQQVNVTYGKNQLISAVCIRKVNDNISVFNRIFWNGKNYILTNKEKKETIVRGMIRSSMVSMYFTPPVLPDTAVMAESFLELTAPVQTGPSKYLTTYKDGNTAVHTYSGGRCVLINATADWGVKLKFVLVSDSDNK
ncbi:MAG: hypothetical protein IT233_10510 [Bacteroidia bacterium]|nr:hypothetical protein [Bacteroidia bacterium]